MNQGNFSQAAVAYAQALTNNPESPQVTNNLGSALYRLGRYEQAIVCYKKAISLKINHAEAHKNLGVVFDRLARWDDAIASYKQALLHDPTYAEACSNLGNTLANRGDYSQAVQYCLMALELKPEFEAAYMHLGNAYKQLGLLSEAVVSYQSGITLAPGNAGLHNNLAVTFRDQGKLREAVESFERAIEARPVYSPAYANMLYFYAFTRHVSPSAERLHAEGFEKTILTDGERAAARQRAIVGGGAFSVHSGHGRRLRLGILTAELCSHPVAEFLEPVLDQLDRGRFQITLFPTELFAGTRGQRFQQLSASKGDSVISLYGVPDEQAAERIRSAQIDVLIETTGHTQGSRLGIVAHRAAPVQCSYIGYWSTTGLTEMDWFITGTGCDASFDAHFTEGLWRLPRLAHCYKGDPSLDEGGWAPDPHGTLWLGSFNNNSKIREETLGLWSGVLHALPEAKLLLEDRALHDEETHERITSMLSGFGIERNRIAFIPYVSGHERHMLLYNRLDIALDTIPFNSGTTAFDALWMGVPLITLDGNWLGGTLASSVVRAFDRPEWVAQDAEQYVSIVRSLARDLAGRKELRRNQRARMLASTLCDAKGMARALEEAFEAMYDRWIDGRDRSIATGQ
jgi:predicted O-linked N-acetylglucosamine transferase (SPINDLY family)